MKNNHIKMTEDFDDKNVNMLDAICKGYRKRKC